MNRKLILYLVALTGLLTYALYSYHDAQPPDEEQIARCNELANQMPQSTREEINRSINTFLDCIAE
jgi:hypothetical protein